MGEKEEVHNCHDASLNSANKAKSYNFGANNQDSINRAMNCDCDIIHLDLVNRAKSSILEEEKLLLIADFYKALSDSTRIKIINILSKNELCVCDIAVILNMTKSAVSHQLKNLREMNLIKSRKQGKVVWYSLADSHVLEVFEVSLEHVLEEIEND